MKQPVGEVQLDDLTDAVAQFIESRASDRELRAFPGRAPRTLNHAYVFQDAAITQYARLGGGHELAGWKIGMVPDPLRDQVGATRFVGPIWSDEVSATEGDGAARGAVFLGTGVVEAEFIVRIGTSDQAESGAGISSQEVEIFLGAELGGTPIAGLGSYGPAALTAAFGNCAGIAAGPRIFTGRFEPERIRDTLGACLVETRINGVLVGTGSALTIPGGIGAALDEARQILARRGRHIPAGTLFATGALTGVHPVQPGDHVEIVGSSIGSLTVEIVRRAPERVLRPA